jgi:hypothetical protein
MDLRELMNTAVADLPELPDQLADVERIHHRRIATKRGILISATTALVLGVGTLSIASPWARPASTGVTAGSSPLSEQQFAENAARILQSIWPTPAAKVVWVRQNNDPVNTSQYTLFKLEEGSKSWQVHLILYGSSATTPYPLVTTLPSDCVMEPADCVVNADGDIHAYDPGSEMTLVYVSTGNNPLYTLVVEPFLVGKPTPVDPSKIVSEPEAPPLTVDQLERLALSDGMRQIYAEGAQAGLLAGGIYSTATPIPSYTP